MGFSKKTERLLHLGVAFMLIAAGFVSFHAAGVLVVVGLVFLAVQHFDRTASGRFASSVGAALIAVAGPIFLSAMLLPYARKPLFELRFWALLIAYSGIAACLAWLIPAVYVAAARKEFRNEQQTAAQDIERLKADWGDILDRPFVSREKY